MRIPSDWQLVKSSEALDIRDGTHDTPEYINEGIPLITSKNLMENGIDFANVQFISFQDHQQIIKRSKVEKGDILYSMIGSIGNVAIVEDDREFSIKNVALFKFNKASLFNRFFFYLLKSPFIQTQINSGQRGGTQKFVSLSTLRNLQIPLPPLEEQKRIAAVLDKADRLRQLDRQLVAKYDQLTQSVFLEMFGDLENNKLNLPIVNLSECCRKITDGTHQSPKFLTTGIPFIFISNIRSNKIYLDTDKFISEDEYKILTKTTPIEIGDVLYTTVGSYGNPALVLTNEKFCFQRHIAHLKPNLSKIVSIYLFGALKSSMAKKQADQYVRGVAQKTLNLTDLKKIRIFLPSLSIQHNFAAIVGSIESQKAKAEESLKKSEALFQALLQQAFKGELFENTNIVKELSA